MKKKQKKLWVLLFTGMVWPLTLETHPNIISYEINRLMTTALHDLVSRWSPKATCHVPRAVPDNFCDAATHVVPGGGDAIGPCQGVIPMNLGIHAFPAEYWTSETSSMLFTLNAGGSNVAGGYMTHYLT